MPTKSGLTIIFVSGYLIHPFSSVIDINNIIVPTAMQTITDVCNAVLNANESVKLNEEKNLSLGQ